MAFPFGLTTVPSKGAMKHAMTNAHTQEGVPLHSDARGHAHIHVLMRAGCSYAVRQTDTIAGPKRMVGKCKEWRIILFHYIFGHMLFFFNVRAEHIYTRD